MSFCLIVAAYAIGLVAPGYGCARWLGGRSPWAVAIPLSLLFLLAGVLTLDALGVPLRLGPVLAWELGVTALLAAAAWKSRPAPSITPNQSENPVNEPASAQPDRWPDRLLVALLVLTGLVVVERGFMAPLSGYDVPFRWEFLALQVLQHHTLAFYPPVTAADFQIYFHPDGFAPVVATGYWWIYAMLGHPSLEALVPLVLAQYLGTLALVFTAATQLHSRRAGLLAVAVLAATPLFFRSVLIGQETGLTALAMTAMVAVLVQAAGPDDWRAPTLAGLLAGVAGLAREYGPALAACGGLVILWRRLGWRALLQFGGVALLVILPWNVRNWLHSGNPLYGHLGGLFPVNPVFDRLMASYQTLFGFKAYGSAQWRDLAWQLLREAGWPLLAGGLAALLLARHLGYLAAGAAAGIALWVWSVGYTSGGVEYSMRVLSPALALLSIAAGVGLARWPAGRTGRWVAGGGLGVGLLYTTLLAAVFPFPLAAAWGQMGAVVSTPYHYAYAEADLAPLLPKVLPSGTRVLTENAYAHRAITVAGANYDLVPVWSPEVAFLFDDRLDATEQRRRLLERGITALFYYPNSPNTAFCRTASAFYARDSGNWQIVGNFRNVFLICRLPPPAGLSLGGFNTFAPGVPPPAGPSP